MPTPNDRTVPSPERDEELEKFIQKRFDLNCVDVPDDDWNHYMVREEDFKRAAIDIAAFSARRARDKAIGECQAAIAVPLIRDDWEMAQQYFVVLLQKLKSPTN